MDNTRAFKTILVGVKCIVFSENRGQARHATVASAQDAGYQVSYGDVEYVKRIPKWDYMKNNKHIQRKVCYSEDHLVYLDRLQKGVDSSGYGRGLCLSLQISLALLF